MQLGPHLLATFKYRKYLIALIPQTFTLHVRFYFLVFLFLPHYTTLLNIYVQKIAILNEQVTQTVMQDLAT